MNRDRREMLAPVVIAVAMLMHACGGNAHDESASDGHDSNVGAVDHGQPGAASSGMTSRGGAPEMVDTSATGGAAGGPPPSGESQAPSADTMEPRDPECGAGRFDSTFAAIQKVIFEGRNCTNDMCHGAAKTGGLDLRADAAYASLIEVKSTIGSQYRVMPGEPDESFLYNKLRAATEPGSVEIEGSSMPSGAAPLSADHLEVIRRWIEAGASKDASVGDSVTGQSDKIAELGSCLPKSTPIVISPLAPPAANEGVQFVMAPYTLPAASEVDVCFAQYYDFSAVVPAEFQDASAGVMYINGQRIRQDPQSHHLNLIHPSLGADFANDPSLGTWQCRGGEREGGSCDPLDASACGAGICATQVQNVSSCLGFGPIFGDNLLGGNVARAQTAQYYAPPRDGVYTTFPIRGLIYWNSHAFNLTTEDTQLHAWVDMYFATSREHRLETPTVADNIFIAAGTPPFTTKNYCATWEVPQGARLYNLTSHTHKHGRNFTVDLPDGTRIYQSAIYSDPVEERFDPPMAFDSTDPAQRTLKYCADFNNGVTQDGMPDLDLVTKLSTMPERTTCTPIACTKGRVGAPCQGSNHAACDTSPGAGDGYCDACAITGGQTTGDEMFALSPSIVTN